MKTFSRAINTTVTTTAAACLEIIAGANSAKVMSITLRLAAATASTYGLGKSAALGITPTTPVALLCDQDILATNIPNSIATMAVAWATPPTVPAAFLRRSTLPATIGSEVIWTFSDGLIIPAGSSIVVWNLATNSANTDIIVTLGA